MGGGERPNDCALLTPPAGGSPSPDIPNWAWHEYGNRVGFWRMLEVLDQLSIKAVLAINGSLDTQVPPGPNLGAIRNALAEAGNDDVTVEELDGLNHLFQTAATGSPAEYAQIEETFAPAVLDLITSWVLQKVGGA